MLWCTTMAVMYTFSVMGIYCCQRRVSRKASRSWARRNTLMKSTSLCCVWLQFQQFQLSHVSQQVIDTPVKRLQLLSWVLKSLFATDFFFFLIQHTCLWLFFFLISRLFNVADCGIWAIFNSRWGYKSASLFLSQHRGHQDLNCFTNFMWCEITQIVEGRCR